jgi:hypothetical protein
MRRRDADDPATFHGTADTRWPVLVCLALSIALHGVLVVAAVTLRSVRQDPITTIHVSLVSGNGNEASGGAADGEVAAPAPAILPPKRRVISASVPQAEKAGPRPKDGCAGTGGCALDIGE